MPSFALLLVVVAVALAASPAGAQPGALLDGAGQRARAVLALSVLNSDAVALWAEEGDQRAAERELVLYVQADSTGRVHHASVVSAEEAGAEVRAAIEQFVASLQNAALAGFDDEVAFTVSFPDRRPPSPWVTGLIVGATLLGTLILIETLR